MRQEGPAVKATFGSQDVLHSKSDSQGGQTVTEASFIPPECCNAGPGICQWRRPPMSRPLSPEPARQARAGGDVPADVSFRQLMGRIATVIGHR